MLQRIKNEVRMTVMYNVIFLLVASAIDVSSFGRFISNLIDNISSAWYWLLATSVIYLLIVYIWERHATTVKDDVKELISEIKEVRKVKEG